MNTSIPLQKVIQSKRIEIYMYGTRYLHLTWNTFRYFNNSIKYNSTLNTWYFTLGMSLIAHRHCLLNSINMYHYYERDWEKWGNTNIWRSCCVLFKTDFLELLWWKFSRNKFPSSLCLSTLYITLKTFVRCPNRGIEITLMQTLNDLERYFSGWKTFFSLFSLGGNDFVPSFWGWTLIMYINPHIKNIQRQHLFTCWTWTL